jgi:hypothetical protein|tara:strand:- start:498 stop:728 length:231 start_codon:yes stop_codon:yes gene_type:complete
MDDSTRISKLEKDLEELKLRLCDKPKKEKKTRAPSEYNEFVKTFLAEQKAKLGESYNHKTAFAEAGQTWSKKKIEK